MRKLTLALCMILILPLAGCKKEQAETTTVNIQIVGTSALIRDENPQQGTPMTLILPVVRPHSADPNPDHEPHVAFVAWKRRQEVSAVLSRVEDKSSDGHDPLDPGQWRVVRLNREEIIVKNDLSQNAILDVGNPPGPCQKDHPDFSCVPRARDFLIGAHIVNTDFLKHDNPHRDLVARMSIRRGTMTPDILCKCEWEFRRNGQLLKQTLMPGVVVHGFHVTGTEVTLQTRDLDDPRAQPVDLVTLKAIPQMPIIKVRIGNSPGIFPVFVDEPLKTDFHYTAYYDLLLTSNGQPVAERDRVLPSPASAQCSCSRPTVTCGPGGG